MMASGEPIQTDLFPQVKSNSSTDSWIRSLLYDAKTVWFIIENYQNIILVWTFLSGVGAFAGPALSNREACNIHHLATHIPLSLLWMIFTALVFAISNQRSPSSIIEDKINKPQRPLPSGRITEHGMRRLLCYLIPVTYILTLFIGGSNIFLLSVVTSWLYNELGAGDENFYSRQILNGVGLIGWHAGSVLVASGVGTEFHTKGIQWIFLLGAAVTFTIAIQDYKDMEGDIAVGKVTNPIVWGMTPSKIFCAVMMVTWAFIACWFWNVDLLVLAIYMVISLVQGIRVVVVQGKRAEALSLELWYVWLLMLCILPISTRF
ncbi:hypothetical protein M501DRAFT_139986 [Patellaria atrata CBS 101060]|uniref:UbiA prenyltransferase n=1 Tax=Patellaria atrata CBS 101060 TaxID=1346257 RepID=A0A9P4S814_9PEZI|nr:hypothetical protein M501DRAFT_139986 [Patellaria atrata CBS 101060]